MSSNQTKKARKQSATAESEADGLGPLSRREGEIMHLLYAEGELTARTVWERVQPQPTYSTIRKLLSILESKGRVTHREEKGVFIYAPVTPREEAAGGMLRRLVDTFFQGSVAQAMTGLLSLRDTRLTPEEFQRLARLLEKNKPHKNP